MNKEDMSPDEALLWDCEEERQQLEARVERLEAREKKLENALEFYADEKNWHILGRAGNWYPPAHADGGERARRVLGEDK